MNRITRPSSFDSSLRTALSRSSNSPRNFRAGQQRAEIQRQDALVAQTLGHLAVDHALGQALDDGGLAHARLADEHRVVLGAALQHLDRAADFVVAADHRVELAVAGALREVDRVAFEGLALILRIGAVRQPLPRARF
jgi:hypothetical protein